MLVYQLASELVFQILSVNNIDKPREVSLYRLLQINEILLLTREAHEDGRDCLEHHCLLMLKILDKILSLLERVKDKSLEVTIVLLQGLCQPLVFNHQLFKATELFILLLTLEITRQHLRYLDNLLFLKHSLLAKFFT